MRIYHDAGTYQSTAKPTLSTNHEANAREPSKRMLMMRIRLSGNTVAIIVLRHPRLGSQVILRKTCTIASHAKILAIDLHPSKAMPPAVSETAAPGAMWWEAPALEHPALEHRGFRADSRSVVSGHSSRWRQIGALGFEVEDPFKLNVGLYRSVHTCLYVTKLFVQGIFQKTCRYYSSRSYRSRRSKSYQIMGPWRR